MLSLIFEAKFLQIFLIFQLFRKVFEIDLIIFQPFTLRNPFFAINSGLEFLLYFVKFAIKHWEILSEILSILKSPLNLLVIFVSSPEFFDKRVNISYCSVDDCKDIDQNWETTHSDQSKGYFIPLLYLGIEELQNEIARNQHTSFIEYLQICLDLTNKWSLSWNVDKVCPRKHEEKTALKESILFEENGNYNN